MTTTLDAALTVPDEIAKAVILPESYGDLEGIVLPAEEWLRKNLPIGRAHVEGYDPVWLVSKHADIKKIATDNDQFHNGDENPLLHTRADDAFARELTGGRISGLDSFSYMDPPLHTEYRGALGNSFQPATIRKKYEDMFRRLAKQLVDEFMELDGECDFVSQFAAIYPTRVTMGVLGVPPEDHMKMLLLTKEFFGGSDPSMLREEYQGLADAHSRQWEATTRDFYGFFQELREQRMQDPQDDLTTYINTRDWPENIKNGFLATVAPAGIDTTAGAIAGGILAFHRFPEQFALVKTKPELIPGLVDECIRWTTPTKVFMRNTTRDLTFRGVEMKKLDRVALVLYSGNHDEDVFPNPHAFDVTRKPNPHLSFSWGPHYCLGVHIAKAEMRILFEELLPRLDSVEVVGKPERELSNLVSNWRTMPIRFTKA